MSLFTSLLIRKKDFAFHLPADLPLDSLVASPHPIKRLEKFPFGTCSLIVWDLGSGRKGSAGVLGRKAERQLGRQPKCSPRVVVTWKRAGI